MKIFSAGRFDTAGHLFARPRAAGEADDVVARFGKSLGDVGAKTFGDAGEQQLGAGHRHQIQRRMLAMIATCASQPAVNVSVRAAGMAAV